MVVAERRRCADPAADGVAVTLGQQVADVSLLMAMAAMDERVGAEYVCDRLAECLCAVDHKQDRLARVEATVDQIETA